MPLGGKIHDVHARALTDITTEALQRIGELDETTGKMGPVITGLIGGVSGAASSITADVVADRPINWTDASISAGAGFVGGMTGNVLLGNSVKGALAGIALSSSATGALNGLKSGMVAGNNCQSSCH